MKQNTAMNVVDAIAPHGRNRNGSSRSERIDSNGHVAMITKNSIADTRCSIEVPATVGNGNAATS